MQVPSDTPGDSIAQGQLWPIHMRRRWPVLSRTAPRHHGMRARCAAEGATEIGELGTSGQASAVSRLYLLCVGARPLGRCLQAKGPLESQQMGRAGAIGLGWDIPPTRPNEFPVRAL